MGSGMDRIIDDPLAITPSWLEGQLRCIPSFKDLKVTSVETETIGAATGFLSRIARLTPSYGANAPQAPSTLILKVQTNREGFTDVAERLQAFERELGFYKDFAPDLQARLPRIFGGYAEGGKGWILMEDLSSWSQGDQVFGISHDQVKSTLKTMAAVHAGYWQCDQLGLKSWLPRHDFWFHDDLAVTWEAVKESYALRLGEAAVALTDRVVNNYENLIAQLDALPQTLVHGDLRADNLLLSSPASSGSDVIVIDWQTVTRSLACIDLAFLIGGSEPTAERHGHPQDPLRYWHQQLVAHGVCDYTYQQALHHLRLALLICLAVPVVAFRELDGPNFHTAREAQLAECFLFRHTQAALDWSAEIALQD